MLLLNCTRQGVSSAEVDWIFPNTSYSFKLLPSQFFGDTFLKDKGTNFLMVSVFFSFLCRFKL